MNSTSDGKIYHQRLAKKFGNIQPKGEWISPSSDLRLMLYDGARVPKEIKLGNHISTHVDNKIHQDCAACSELSNPASKHAFARRTS